MDSTYLPKLPDRWTRKSVFIYGLLAVFAVISRLIY